METPSTDPQGPESPSLKVLITGVAGYLLVIALKYPLLPHPYQPLHSCQTLDRGSGV